MDQQTILTKASLSLSEDIEDSKPESGILILKNIPLRTYLVVSSRQWMILSRFRDAMSLQELIPRLISERRSPPLRELYELILKAVVAGILLVDGELMADHPRVKAEEWQHKLRLRFANWLGVICVLFGFGTLVTGAIQLPESVFEMLIAYLIICGCLSVGYFLSACLLAGFDREVYDVRLKWKHPFPHLYCNVEDARMAGRLCENTVALTQMAPLFLFIGLSAIWFPQLEYILLLGIFYLTLPDQRSAGTLLIRSLYRHIPLSTNKDFLFVQNQLFWTMLNKRIKFADKRYLIIYSAYTLLWLGTVCLVNVSAFNINAVKLFQRFIESGGVKWVGVFLLFLMGSLALLSLAFLIWIFLRNLLGIFEKVRSTNERSGSITSLELTTHDILAFFKDSMLFKELDETTMHALADRVQGLIVNPRKYVIHEGDEGDMLYIVYQGSMEVLMNLKSGRPLKIADLRAGDVFGEVALIQHIPRTRSVRATKRSLLLTLRNEDFESLVVEHLGARRIQDIVEKQAFLSRIELCRHWHPQALARFAQLTRFATFQAKDRVINKGMANQFFYLIYDGMLEVSTGDKTLAKLTSGQFFGEISLLQNSVSTADVTAVVESRCLVVTRREFLSFMATDFLIGLQFEEISSKRLKHDIFPLTGVSYDESAIRG